jgi:hypothetical protein
MDRKMGTNRGARTAPEGLWSRVEVYGEGARKGAVGRLGERVPKICLPGVRHWFASRAVSRPAYRGKGSARYRVWEVPGG